MSTDGFILAVAAFRRHLALPLALLLAAACTSIHSTQQTFAGTKWRVVAVSGQVATGNSMEFGTSSVRGELGCNLFEGPYQVDEGQLLLAQIRTTERGCVDPAVTAIEQRGHAILAMPMQIRWQSGSALTLSNSAGSIDLELLG